MCGISAYIGLTPRKVNELLASAVVNRHRGNDGVGIIYKDSKDNKLIVTKSLLHLEELFEKKLSEERANVRKRVGSLGIMCKDEELYDKIQKEHEDLMMSLLNTESNLIVVHHRKATCGDNKVENLHPFEYNKKLYVHNGTIDGYQAIKNWLFINNGIEFKSDTDTEVLAVVYNHLKTLYKNKPKEIFKRLTEMFPNGFGVLLEIDNNEITIIKDDERDLWAYIYGQNNDRIYLVSEPIPDRERFTKLYRLKEGIYNTKHLLIDDFTKEGKEAIICWNGTYNKSHPKTTVKCECCGSEDKVVCDSYYMKSGPLKESRENRCFECLIRSDLIAVEENEEEEDESTRETYESFIEV